MFSKISQLSKTFADEINRINDEVNSPNSGEQSQLADPEIAKRIIATQTPDISEIDTPESVTAEDSASEEQRELGGSAGPANKGSEDVTQVKLGSDLGPSIESETRANSTEPNKSLGQKDGSLQQNRDARIFVPGTEVKLLSLPPEIRSRLNKYFKYEKKYPQLYEAYKIEKKKTALIHAFENMLKEQTPCSSIGELNAVRDYLVGINNQGKMLNSELAKTAKDKKAADDKISALNQKIKDLQKALTSRNTDEANELQNLREEIQLLKSESSKRTDLVSQVNSLTSEKQQLQDELREYETLKSKLDELQDAKSDGQQIRDQLDASMKEKEEQSERLRVAEKDLENLKALYGNYESNSKAQYEESKARIIDLEKQLESSKKLNDLFKDKLETLTSEAKNTTSVSASTPTASSQSKNSRKKKNKKQNQNNNKAIEEPQNSKTTETLIPDISTGINSPEVELIEAKHELDKLNTRYEEEVSKNKELEKSIREKSTEIEELKDMLRNVGDSLVESQKENKTTHDLEKVLEQTKSELEAKLHELEMLRLQNSNALTDYEKTKASLSKKVHENVEKVEELQSLLDKKTLEAESLQKKVDDLFSNTRNLESLLSKNKTNEKSLQEKLTSITEEKNKLASELELLRKSTANDSVNKSELQNIKTQLARKERVLVEAENKIKFLQEEKSKVNDHMIELKVQNKELKNQEASYQEAKGNLTRLNEKLKSEVNEGTLKINKFSLENTKLAKKLEELQDQYNEVKHIKSSSNDQVESLKRRVEELTMRNKEYENRIDVLQEELTQSRNMLQERTREMTTMRKLVMDNEETQNLDRKELKSKFDRLLEEKEKADNEALLTIRNKQREIEELKRKQSDLSSQLEELEAKNSTLSIEIKNLSDHKQSEEFQRFTSNGASKEKSIQEVSDYNSKIIETLRESLNKTEARLREIEEMNAKLRTVNQDSSDKLIRLNKKYKLLSLQYKRRMSESSAHSSRKNSFVTTNDVVDAKLLHPAVDGEKQYDNEDLKEKSIYIKNVLMGFLEHKEQRQMLLPVIKMLLYMSDDDTKKLNELFV
ncbi:hypothetical protein PMKS-000590 [Pichia membranifaciens]|uniref:GRIP domain-containing protein n=1 Tax=Pichia membranifaciens TaxID=4926 RepID=A0A1Q2YC69_9ASCO|nr:hypothetical protein PMKS-000590 [Pichia membranifaciens]